ncbi:putative Leucine rich repeat protein [Leptomonas seymouri]|uniref:Putative Leucine rich repeat protein n=1 Tax=Leptomonas seymouri TaxID=5684 RepID=A0A0N1PC33_LEPSE|nr:putative Leucine rich repeat protein [Leptomonas seymouri]|eukprot:KPI86362.1 putative Leucine rich repeat protein [Leptomonas seymouri]
MSASNVEQTPAATQDGRASSKGTAAGARGDSRAAASTSRAASSPYINHSARRHASAGSARTSTTTGGLVSATVQRLYQDPSSRIISWRRSQAKPATASSRPIAALEVPKREPSCAQPPARALQERQKLPLLHCHGKTAAKAPPLVSAQPADCKRRSTSPTSTSEAPSSASQLCMEAVQCAEGSSTSNNGVKATPSSDPCTHEDAVVCVVLSETPARTIPRVLDVRKGDLLDLRSRGLTALPCLHRPCEETDASHRDAADGAVKPSRVPLTGASAHGSGDAFAVCLHVLNLRQNRITTLLTPCPLANASGPRSTPLQFYAHISSLDFTHNELASISGIEVLRCLRSLRLAFNKLTSLAPLWASPYVAELEVLDVSSNDLTELMTMEDVHAMELHHVRVVTRPTQARATTGGRRSTKATTTYKSMRLRVLYASSNALCSIPSAVYTLSSLADLRLRDNKIESVPEGFPSRVCLPVLARLDLSMNCLPSAVVNAITARVEGAVGGSQVYRGTSSPHAENNSSSGGSSNSSRHYSGSSARCARQPDGAPSSASPSALPSASTKAAAVEAEHGGVTQQEASSNAAPSERGSTADVKRAETPPSQPPVSEAAVAAPTRPEVSEVSRCPLDSSPKPSSSLPLRKQRQHRCPPDTATTSMTSTAAVVTPVSVSSEPHRTSATREGMIAEEGEACNVSERSEQTMSVASLPSTAAAPPSTTKVARKAAASSSDAATADATSEFVESTSDGGNPPSTTAMIAASESAVECINENVYCVHVGQWAARLHQRLTSLTKGAAAATVEAEDASPQLTEHELLAALFDSVGGCVATATSPTGAWTNTAGTLKSARQRPASTTRATATLLQCLPSASSLSFPEDTQVRSPPLLILTGISAGVTASHQQRLLYEVLVHNLVQSCLCTPKAEPTASAGASRQSRNSSPTQSTSLPPNHRRTNSLAREHATCSPPPPAAITRNASWRSAGNNSNSGESRAGRCGATTSAAARQLSFHVPLQVIHVMDKEDTRGMERGTDTRGALLWSYVAWRQMWEVAVSRRRFRHHSKFVCEVKDNSLPVAQSPAEDATVGNAMPCAAGLYPVACSAAPLRCLEWRRLCEVRPASYAPLPAPWEMFYEQLHRVNVGGTPCPVGCVPPILRCSSDHLHSSKISPAFLSCTLLRAVEMPNAVSGNAAWTPSIASSSDATSPQTSTLYIAGAVKTAYPSSSGGHRRQAPASSRTYDDAVTHVVLRRQCGQHLARRIEAETLTVAEEQVPPCAMPLYNTEDIRQSQQAALLKFSQWTVAPSHHEVDRISIAAVRDEAATSSAVEVAQASSDASPPSCSIGNEAVYRAEEWEVEVEVKGDVSSEQTAGDAGVPKAAESTPAFDATPSEQGGLTEATSNGQEIASCSAGKSVVDSTPLSPREGRTEAAMEASETLYSAAVEK